jgi:hypothetical protein
MTCDLLGHKSFRVCPNQSPRPSRHLPGEPSRCQRRSSHSPSDTSHRASHRQLVVDGWRYGGRVPENGFGVSTTTIPSTTRASIKSSTPLPIHTPGAWSIYIYIHTHIFQQIRSSLFVCLFVDRHAHPGVVVATPSHQRHHTIT